LFPEEISARNSRNPQIPGVDTCRLKLNAIETAAEDSADKTRNAFAYTALWLFISLLIGAFYSSLAATYGGRQRNL
jgi:hypothetical protein